MPPFFTNIPLPFKLVIKGCDMMSGDVFRCCCSAAFGLESLVAGELRSLGLQNISTENGLVRFDSAIPEIFRCNLSLRFCDRVMIILAEGKCLSFEDLFQLVSSVPWEKYIHKDEAINVSAHCARSKIMSPRDCQSITKKAIIERLKARAGLRVFPETGVPFPVLVAVHSDCVRIMLNTSGDALSRRGYRTWNGEAPIRETLAAALVSLSPWKPGMPLCDPCCGTGTILAEAAFMAANRLPGLTRSFAMEQFYFTRGFDLNAIRREAENAVDYANIAAIYGSDIDPEAISLAKRHMRQAGLENHVSLSVIPLQEVCLDRQNGVFVCNPPYGERLSDQAASRQLYRELHHLADRHPGWSLCAISSDPAFEKAYGMKAHKKRRLYNGRLECTYYIYYGRRNPESF